MRSFVLSSFVFCAVLATVDSPKCYVCAGTKDDCKNDKLAAGKDKYSSSCPTGTRMRVWGKKDDETKVAETCTTKAFCDAAKKACDDNTDDGDCAVGCCDNDYCNAGSSASFGVFLMTVCSVLSLALLK